MRVWRGGAAVVAVTSALSVPVGLAGSAEPASIVDDSEAGTGELATFEGRIIDLSRSWAGAQACVVWPDLVGVTECFSSEAEL